MASKRKKLVKLAVCFVLFISLSYSRMNESLMNATKILGALHPVVNATNIFRSLERDPTVDKSPPSLTDEGLVAVVNDEVPNLPLQFWQTNSRKRLAMNKTCARFPNLYDLSYNNIYWQTLTTSNTTFHLFGAYYDNRTILEGHSAVRLVGVIYNVVSIVKAVCQFWYNNRTKPVFADVFEYRNMLMGYNRMGEALPYLISCHIPQEYSHLVPDTVSLVENACDTATTNLKVINNQPPSGKKEDFAVCVKALDFRHFDASVRLVEWLELLFILGAKKVILYDLDVHPNVSKVLHYYKEQGRIDVTKLTLPGKLINVPNLIHKFLKQKMVVQGTHEIIAYTDCFYKNMNKYDYIAVIDTDEVIMPKSSASWKSLMETVLAKAQKQQKDPFAAFMARSVNYFDTMLAARGLFDDIPKYMHMMQHAYRASEYNRPGAGIKCFHNTERVLLLHNHFPRTCLGGTCRTFPMDTEDAQMQHYRHCWYGTQEYCIKMFENRTTLDAGIWRFREPLLKSVKDTLVQLGFLNP